MLFEGGIVSASDLVEYTYSSRGYDRTALRGGKLTTPLEKSNKLADRVRAVAEEGAGLQISSNLVGLRGVGRKVGKAQPRQHE
jgi:hypothetical protein